MLALAASPSGDSIYAGGDLTSVNGVARGHVVVISASTGRIRKEWNAHADLPVYSLATWGRRVYLGGEFCKVNGRNRQGLAAMRRKEGKLYANWTPTTNGIVRTLGLSLNKRRLLYAAGNYSVLCRGLQQGALSHYRTKCGDGHFAGAAGAIVTSVCFRRPQDQTTPPSI